MLGYITILIVFGVLTFGWFLPYIGLVYLNSITTSQFLPISAVAGYSPDVVYPNAMEEYGAEWVIFLTEPLDFYAPAVCLICFLLIYANITQAKYILRLYFALDLALIILRFIYRIVSYAFCDKYGQLCRSLDPADKTGYFETTNLIWDILFWNNLAIFFWNLMLLLISWDIEERAKRERDDDTRRILVENGKRPEEIEALFYLKRQEMMNKNEEPMPPPPQPPPYEDEQPPVYIPQGELVEKQSIRNRIGRKQRSGNK